MPIAEPVPVVTSTSDRSGLAALLFGVERLSSAANSDEMLRSAVELAQSSVGLERVMICLLDDTGRRLSGSWGTDADGRVVDQHHLVFDCDERVAAVFRRAESEGQLFTVLAELPVVKPQKSTAAGRRWVACTPIRAPGARIGMMFNESSASNAPLEQGRQEQAALLCLMLGSVIELTRARRAESRRDPAQHPLARKAVEMLAQDPALTGKEMAAQLGISVSQLVRLFKMHVGTSLVGYRNRLRMERFQKVVSAGEDRLHDAALAAGFGSYAQFHRVFRATYGTAPSSYMRSR